MIRRPDQSTVCFISFFVVFVTMMSGCGTLRVRPPTQINDPVRVHVIDYGRTSRLVLPAYGASDSVENGSGDFEYAFGDWNWYAFNRDSNIDAAAAILIPTLGTLGRREVSLPGATPSGEYGTVYTFDVSRSASERLRKQLDATIDDPARERIFNEERGMEFVKLGTSYWLPRQSSTQMKSWLQDLGCHVRGWTLIAEFEFEK